MPRTVMGTTRDTTPLFLSTGALFNERYRVVRRLKTGGMGAVYEVVDERLDRRRALKVMHPEVIDDAELRARFELETKATANVCSEHIVETTDAGVDPETGAPFLVMELLHGEDLEIVLQRRGPLPVDEVVVWLRQVARALDRLHAANVVHRDLKPANIFLTKSDDASPLVKVFDFGVARKVARTPDEARTTRILGTPAYMSPEQIRGEGSIGPPSDLYALGHVAFALFVGQPYWSPEVREEGMWLLASKVVLGLPEPATARGRKLGAALPPPFDAWFAKATAVAPGERFATASEVVDALAVALSSVQAPELGLRPRSPRLERSVRVRAEGLLLVGALAALAATGVFARSLTRASRAGASPTPSLVLAERPSAGTLRSSAPGLPPTSTPADSPMDASPSRRAPGSPASGASARPSTPTVAAPGPPPRRTASSATMSAEAHAPPAYDPADRP